MFFLTCEFSLVKWFQTVGYDPKVSQVYVFGKSH